MRFLISHGVALATLYMHIYITAPVGNSVGKACHVAFSLKFIDGCSMNLRPCYSATQQESRFLPLWFLQCF